MWLPLLPFVTAVLLSFTTLTTFALPASDNLQSVNTPTDLITTNTYDPYASYKGVGTVEVWIGSNRVNVGNMIGEELHNNLVAIIASLCPWNSETFRCADWPDVITLPVKDVDFDYSPWDCQYHGRCAHGSTVRVVSASFPTDTIRKLLIETVASAYSAMSKRIGNCYGGHTVTRDGLMCSVADQLKVNTPGGYMHLQLGPVNYDYNGHFHCCEILLRQWVDKEMDKLKPEWMAVHPLARAKYRDVMCQVETCKEGVN